MFHGAAEAGGGSGLTVLGNFPTRKPGSQNIR